MKPQRCSEIELLRIISMLLVLIVHIDGASLGLPDARLGLDTPRDWWRIAVEAIAIIGVNCFTLISGYFGIRLRIRSVAAFLFQCIFYAVGIATLACLANPVRYGLDYWAESWMVLTHTDLWYIPAYFMLMLLSPMLNAGFASMTRRQAIAVTAAVVTFNLWAGWIWQQPFNPTGYTAMQLVMIYMIGRCVSLFPRPSRTGGLVWIAVWALSTAAIAATCFFTDTLRAFAYNSPFVILSSVSLLLFFLSLDLRSRVVNSLARASFAVYLVHKAPVVWGGFMKPFVVKCWASMSLAGFSVTALLLATGIYLAVVPLDILRRRISSLIIK